MKEIKLTQGYVTQVDDDMYDYLNQWKWHYHSGYAARTFWENGKMRVIKMHTVIMGAVPGMEIDHKKSGGLLNLRSNLRICTKKENLRNRGKQKNNTSGYKGVTMDKRNKKWQARIMVNSCSLSLGFYDDPETAARAYDKAALKYHGDFSALNFPKGDE